MRELKSLPGVFLMEPQVFPDNRGTFNEWFKASDFEEALGYPFDLQQANISVSHPGVVRGVHFADVPPGQAKFVICAAGTIRDVVMDLRVGSPTFGQQESVELSSGNRKGIYIPVGCGHAFQALEESTVVYLTTSEYNPEAEHAISVEDLHVEWALTPVLSAKDRQAPSLGQALAQAKLPQYDACQAWEESLKNAWVDAFQEGAE